VKQIPLWGKLVPLVALVLASFAPPGMHVVQAANQTVVSLTFDDGLSDQTTAAQQLEAHGMRGTFYIISGRVGSSGSLTTSQLLALQNSGHEIGGHTVTHPDLTTLSSSQQQQEICGGKTALQNLGLTVTNLAYPFGSYNSTSQSVAKGCGYKTARTVGDLEPQLLLGLAPGAVRQRHGGADDGASHRRQRLTHAHPDAFGYSHAHSDAVPHPDSFTVALT
jgi:peptidoglycan/xylan/chitin deacetylase (PgdA/CDA1 family)